MAIGSILFFGILLLPAIILSTTSWQFYKTFNSNFASNEKSLNLFSWTATSICALVFISGSIVMDGPWWRSSPLAYVFAISWIIGMFIAPKMACKYLLQLPIKADLSPSDMKQQG